MTVVLLRYSSQKRTWANSIQLTCYIELHTSSLIVWHCGCLRGQGKFLAQDVASCHHCIVPVNMFREMSFRDMFIRGWTLSVVEIWEYWLEIKDVLWKYYELIYTFQMSYWLSFIVFFSFTVMKGSFFRVLSAMGETNCVPPSIQANSQSANTSSIWWFGTKGERQMKPSQLWISLHHFSPHRTASKAISQICISV